MQIFTNISGYWHLFDVKGFVFPNHLEYSFGIRVQFNLIPIPCNSKAMISIVIFGLYSIAIYLRQVNPRHITHQFKLNANTLHAIDKHFNFIHYLLCIVFCAKSLTFAPLMMIYDITDCDLKLYPMGLILSFLVVFIPVIVYLEHPEQDHNT